MILEYRRTSEALGVVISDTLALACFLPPPWYWTLARIMVVEYPMVLLPCGPPLLLSNHTGFIRTNTSMVTIFIITGYDGTRPIYSCQSTTQHR